MNKIISIDPSAGTLVAEAGCILEDLDNELRKHGLIMPLDLGAKGSCQIGGNISTNAGGLRFLRYGSLRGSVLGLEMVLPNGEIVDDLSTLRKDNTGYDLKQLFIGGEGTLGIISRVSMAVPRRPTSVHLAFVAVNDYESVLKVMEMARSDLSDIISALEFQDRQSLSIVLDHVANARDPLSLDYRFYVIIETSGYSEEFDSIRLNNFLEKAMENNVVLDGVLAQDSDQVKEFWALREDITPSLNAVGFVYKYDLSVPVQSMYKLVDLMRDRLDGVIDPEHITGYGHLGDANLHLNIVAPRYDDEIRKKIEPYVYEVTSAQQGSISAEHGLGAQKGEHMHFSKSPEMIALFRRIKNLFDPNSIMNPYKFLPDTASAARTSRKRSVISGA
jgi:D-2-hydroxyglutarate dehydrogenase